jgi:hypothetical protein
MIGNDRMSKQKRIQSTGHIMMMEPVDFHANEQTKETNSYQHDDDRDQGVIQSHAQKEFRAFRDLLVEHGVMLTTLRGQKGCPDDIFCNNWVSTHQEDTAIFYPMLAPNRQIERRPELLDWFRKQYGTVLDYSAAEQEGVALESTGAMALDRVNRIAYQNLSRRSDRALGAKWCAERDFTHFVFETDYKGKPVYHADVVLWIGTKLAGICSESLVSRDVVEALQKTHEVIEFTNEQMKAFCGNALEVVGWKGERMLVMSDAGYESLRDDQKEVLTHHYKTIIRPKIPWIEYYGGGSARCMMLEIF